VLISGAGVRVVEGGWWPVLNGRRILYGTQNHLSLISPVTVPAGDDHVVRVHCYPEELRPDDELADGETAIATIETPTFLAWVDLLPEAYFTHPTAYVLVGADGKVAVHEGGWWPVLNGKTVLYGSDGAFAASFPFALR